ncbi:MAG: succinate dehydrogenase/fumarate reductase iron-sulfur subunit [Nitrospirae bacterium]|nr:succinate dehydrogenase/fumarate reductase iron-sulfur subunit [Nitrospirota bacterium]
MAAQGPHEDSTRHPRSAAGGESREAILRVFRGDPRGGEAKEYKVPVGPGMVVLDAIHHIQGYFAPDLACRWNCKAAKCGSCSAEVNGRPRLMCKTRLDEFAEGEIITVYPLRSFPLIKDLVTDVSRNFEVNKRIPPFAPKPSTEWRMQQPDVDRVQEFRKCIECFLCQDVCHVIRNHNKLGEFAGPRFFVRSACLEMHPLDGLNRTRFLKEEAGLGYCNITKCCTEVCPEDIHITDNAIIPLKERVVSEFYSPLGWLRRKLAGK